MSRGSESTDASATATGDEAGLSGLRSDWEQASQRVIEALAGPEARLRPDQREAVAALSQDGARVLVVQATGWGKSAVYWCATAARRASGAGPTLVVSPLLALMRDQVEAAGRGGLRAVTINSSNFDAWGQVEQALLADEVDVLLVSPERLANPTFGRRVLDVLTGRIGLLVIDEAHSISDWGHDFRPDYRRVTEVLAKLDDTVPVLATTATANERVTADVAAQLGAATSVQRGPLGRDSLQLAVTPHLSPLERHAWVADHLPKLPGSGIVYALTIADADRALRAIRAVHGEDYPVETYTGQLDTGERERLEGALRRNEVKALVATSALGMGYDKPDLGFVVHLGSPPSPVSYYQQVGRAGRGIAHALVVLLPSHADDGVWHYFATATLPDERMARRLLDELGTGGPDEARSVVSLEATTGLRRGRVELLLRQLAVDGAVDRVPDGWVGTGVPWVYDAEHYAGIVAVREREASIMRDYLAGRSCLMELLRRSLDDEQAGPCGRCSVCLDGLPEPLGPKPDTETVAVVARALRGTHHVLDPRKMWPGGDFGRRGRIPVAEAAAPGRVLVHADAPEWQEALAAYARDELDPALRDHAVAVLARWKDTWVERPQVVVALNAEGHPRVVEGVAEHLASVGRLDRAVLELAPGAMSGDEAGPAEAAHWACRLHLPEPEQLRDRCVLLVVDATSTGWVVTVAASLLRSSGSGPVLPLVIHRRP